MRVEVVLLDGQRSRRRLLEPEMLGVDALAGQREPGGGSGADRQRELGEGLQVALSPLDQDAQLQGLWQHGQRSLPRTRVTGSSSPVLGYSRW